MSVEKKKDKENLAKVNAPSMAFRKRQCRQDGRDRRLSDPREEEQGRYGKEGSRKNKVSREWSNIALGRLG